LGRGLPSADKASTGITLAPAPALDGQQQRESRHVLLLSREGGRKMTERRIGVEANVTPPGQDGSAPVLSDRRV
jgi:hypothetical protein